MIKCLLVVADGKSLDHYVWMPRVPCKGEIVRVDDRTYQVGAVRWENVSSRPESDPFDWGVMVMPRRLIEYVAHVYLS